MSKKKISTEGYRLEKDDRDICYLIVKEKEDEKLRPTLELIESMRKTSTKASFQYGHLIDSLEKLRCVGSEVIKIYLRNDHPIAFEHDEKVVLLAPIDSKALEDELKVGKA